MNQDPDQNPKSLLDRVVFFVADTLDALGLNGTRLRWKWNQKRIQLGESGMKAENLWRSARSKHKMCPSCRALVARGAQTCEECGTPLASVRAPGFGRLVANVLPGSTAATSLILLANGFWFLMTMMAQIRGGAEFGLFSSFSGELLVEFGSGLSPYTLAGEWWRIVTPIFLHGSILHFFFNSYVLLLLGPMVEEEFGTERFWVIYLLCGIAGSAASQLGSDLIRGHGVNTVGASGANLGLMGLLLVYGWRRGGSFGETMKRLTMRFLIYIVIFSLLFGRSIDHVNHVAGFACGALLALIVPSGRYRNPSEARAWEITAIAGVLLVVYCFYKVAASALA